MMFKRHVTEQRLIAAILTAALLITFFGTANAADLTSLCVTVSDPATSGTAVTQVMKFTVTVAETNTKAEPDFSKKDDTASDLGHSWSGASEATASATTIHYAATPKY